MSVPTEVSEVAYLGNGASKSFPVPYPFHENSHLVVTLTPSGGEPVLQTLGVDYSVSGAGGDSGTVTFLSAPESGETVTITREVPIIQDVAFRTHGTFSPRTHENALDYRAMVDQQLDRRLTLLEAGDLGGGSGVPLSSATPQPVHSSAGAAGVSTSAARADHIHKHGELSGGNLHAVATSEAAGFMSAGDKSKLDGIPPGGGGGGVAEPAIAGRVGTKADVTLASSATKSPFPFDVVDMKLGSGFDVGADHYITPMGGIYRADIVLTATPPEGDAYVRLILRVGGNVIASADQHLVSAKREILSMGVVFEATADLEVVVEVANLSTTPVLFPLGRQTFSVTRHGST